MSNKTSAVSEVCQTVLEQLSVAMKDKLGLDTNIAVTYSPDLSPEAGLRSFRNNVNIDSSPMQTSLDDLSPNIILPQGPDDEVPIDLRTSLPHIMWSRSIIRRLEPIGRKGVSHVRGVRTGPEVALGMFFQGELDLRLKIFFGDMEDLELFELLYYSESGISDLIRFNLSIKDTLGNVIDDVIYRLTWDDLESLENNLKSSSYISVELGAKLSGVFFSYQKSAPIILYPQLTLESNLR